MSGTRSAQVPTKDEFDALTAKVDKNTADIASLNTRVTKLEGGGGNSPSNKVPSADGTTVTSTSGQIVDGDLRTFKLTGAAGNYVIDVDGVKTGGGVVRLYAKSRLCYQENSHHNWWYLPLGSGTAHDNKWIQCPNPTGEQPPIPPQPSGVPPMAAEVGYNKRTHGPHVTLGQNWFAVPGASNGVRQNSDGSVTDLGPINGGNWHYNFHFGTERDAGGGNFGGVAFGGGGYFEIVMSIQGNIKGWCTPGQGDCNGWPAWWFDALEGAYKDFPNPPCHPMQHIEYDAAEFLPASNRDYSAGIIHWSDANSPPDRFNNNSTGQDSNVHIANQTDFSGRNKFGWLWVPATSTTQGYCKQYYNDKQVGATYTWTPYTGGSKPGDPGCPPWSVLDMQHCRMMVGTCTQNPLTVYACSVWQKDDSKNVRRGTPLPA